MSSFVDREFRASPSVFEQGMSTLQLPEGPVRVVQMMPKDAQGIALFIPGLGQGLQEIRTPLEALTARKIGVVSSQTPQRDMKYPAGVFTEAQKEAGILAGVVKAIDMQTPLTLITHSKGIHEALALAEAGLVHRLYCINPVGLSEKHGVRHLLSRGARSAWGSVTDKSTHISATHPFRSTFNIAKDAPGAFGRRLLEIANTPLVERILTLRQNDVEMTFLHAEEDRTLPIDEVQRNAELAGVHGGDFIRLPGGHDVHLQYPGLVMGIIADRMKRTVAAPSGT